MHQKQTKVQVIDVLNQASSFFSRELALAEKSEQEASFSKKETIRRVHAWNEIRNLIFKLQDNKQFPSVIEVNL